MSVCFLLASLVTWCPCVVCSWCSPLFLLLSLSVLLCVGGVPFLLVVVTNFNCCGACRCSWFSRGVLCACLRCCCVRFGVWDCLSVSCGVIRCVRCLHVLRSSLCGMCCLDCYLSLSCMLLCLCSFMFGVVCCSVSLYMYSSYCLVHYCFVFYVCC